MSLSSANATALVRSLIKEASARFWTDAEITLYLSSAMDTTWARYSNLLYPRYKSWAAISLTNGNADYNKPSGCFKISKIVITSNGHKLRLVGDDEMFKFEDANPSAASDYLTCYYLPTYTDITTFPDSLQTLCCVEAAILAKTKDEDVTPDLLDLRKHYEDAALFELSVATLDEVNVFADFTEEKSLTEEYAWTYKAGAIHLLEPQNA